MKACRDRKTLRTNGWVLLATGGIFLAGAIIGGIFLTDRAARFFLPLALAAAALICFSVLSLIRKRLREDPAFVIEGQRLLFGRKEILLQDIQHVQVYARISRSPAAPDTRKTVDRLALLPPLPHLCGSVTVTTLRSRHTWTNLCDVMELLACFCRSGIPAEAVYVDGDQYRPYLYLLYDPTLEKYESSFSPV
jgi:hypothetical protein